MSDPFIPVSSPNGLEVPWDMIMSEGATWNPPREGAPPIPNMPVYSQPTMPQPQYPYPQPYNPTMPTQRIDYNLPIDGVSKTRSTIRINVGQWLRSALKIRAPTTWDAKARSASDRVSPKQN